MSVLAVYIVPHLEDTLYQVGSNFLGYNVRTGAQFKPLLSDKYDEAELKSWIGRARIFGFHATVGDAIEYADEDISEIETRLHWIAGRVSPFTLINGRFHNSYRNAPKTLAATFDSPDRTLYKLHYLVVTTVNVLHKTSPFFDSLINSSDEGQKEYLVRYGAPHRRILDRFELHFSFATGIPNHQIYYELQNMIIEKTNLFRDNEHQVLKVDEIHLLEKQSNGFFQIIATFPLLGIM